jgi:hypothetical protein
MDTQLMQDAFMTFYNEPLCPTNSLDLDMFENIFDDIDVVQTYPYGPNTSPCYHVTTNGPAPSTFIIDPIFKRSLPSSILFKGTCHDAVKDDIDDFTTAFNKSKVPSIVFPKGTGKDTAKDGAENMLYIQFMSWVPVIGVSKEEEIRHACLLGDRHCLGAIREAHDMYDKGFSPAPHVTKRCKVIKGDMCCNQHNMKMSLVEKFEEFYKFPFSSRYQNLRVGTRDQ